MRIENNNKFLFIYFEVVQDLISLSINHTWHSDP